MVEQGIQTTSTIPAAGTVAPTLEEVQQPSTMLSHDCSART